MPIDLDELERLEREATPGPWKIAITKLASGYGWYVVDAHGDFIAGANAPNPSTDEPNTRCVAAARNALPDLIAELRMLRTLRARVAELEHDLSTSEGIRARIRELEAEIDMLTSELEVVEEAEAEEVPGG